MSGSVPLFGAPEDDGRYPWKEVENIGVLGEPGSGRRWNLNVDLLMVRDRDTGRFVYTERLERRSGETPWEYVRRSVRREAQIREHFKGEGLQVIVGWGAGSVEEFLESYPEYGPVETTDGESGGRVEQ